MQFIKFFFFVLVVPSLAVVVFLASPRQLSKNLTKNLLQSLERAEKLAPTDKAEWKFAVEHADYEVICRQQTEAHRRFVQTIGLNDACESFQRWAIVRAVAYVDFGLVLLYLVLLLTSARLAQKSPARLISAYRMAWLATVFMTVVTLVVMATLGVYTLFQLSVLLTDRYIPKLLIMMGIGALVALFRVLKTIFKKVPLEFAQSDAAEVEPNEAPLLWERVRTLSEKVGTEPPTSILVGSELNFFVTELSISHMNGKSHGRVLYLSSRMMKVMTTGEVEAVIGHELGHFKGQDTALTRAFYPFRLKTGLTLSHLQEGGLVTLPAVALVANFYQVFEPVIATYSRLRELKADEIGASVSTPGDLARSLLKMQLHSRAYEAAYIAALKEGKSELPEESKIFADYLKGDGIWDGIGETQLVHPIDSHPPTAGRLKALGCELPHLQSEIMQGSVTSAFEAWFSEGAHSVKQVEESHEQLVKAFVSTAKVSGAHVDITTPEGRARLERAWIPQQWEVSPIKAVRETVMPWGIIGAGLIVLGGTMTGQKFAPWLGWIVGTVLTAVTIAILYRRWQGLKESRFELTVDGLKLNSWTRPVPFSHITNLAGSVNNGTCTMTLTLAAPTDHPAKYRWLTGPVKTISVNLSIYRAAHEDIYGAVGEYWVGLR